MLNIIVEGIDRIGKDTFIEKLHDWFGYQVIHSGKPKKSKAFGYSYQKYQEYYFTFWFNVMKDTNPGFIFNRFHLGEFVYSPLYREYDPGEYLYELEKPVVDKTCLVLLYTTDFSIITDDGNSFDFTKKEQEQKMFIDSFKKSNLKKFMLQVNNGNKFRDPDRIFSEAMKELARFS